MAIAVHLDTDACSACIGGDPDACFIVNRAPRIAVSCIVLGELKAGFALGSRTPKNTEELDESLAGPRNDVALVDPQVAERYARIHRQLKRDGRPIPTNGIWIAAVVATDADGVLFTRDQHLEAVDGLRPVRDAAALQKLLG